MVGGEVMGGTIKTPELRIDVVEYPDAGLQEPVGELHFYVFGLKVTQEQYEICAELLAGGDTVILHEDRR